MRSKEEGRIGCILPDEVVFDDGDVPDSEVGTCVKEIMVPVLDAVDPWWRPADTRYVLKPEPHTRTIERKSETCLGVPVKGSFIGNK